ncbi:hypothetical protein [Streptomyces sp. NPDC021356]|uniref:hypothetical protein n=1 Tax=Streptomyces sp. NPDC021356 TaxID=3154900 RepID=UPI0033F942CB
MEEHDSAALHAAFQVVLSAQPDHVLPSVTDAAVAGGRRIRRRRAALSAAAALAATACVATAAVSLSGAGAEHTPLPLAPLAPASATHPPTPAPKDSTTPSGYQTAANAVPHHTSPPDQHGRATAPGTRAASRPHAGSSTPP